MVLVIELVLVALAVFWLGYWVYSARVTRLLEVSDRRRTPAHRHADGREFVPAKRPVLLGHHFSSIAGGGPIVGPITAAAAFGWLPALGWILAGNVFFGSMHDYVTTMGSVRHEGRSIGALLERYVGRRGQRLFLLFATLTVVLVLAAFALVIAYVFEAYPSAATASVAYTLLGFGFGLYLYRLKGPLLGGTLGALPLLFGSIFLGLAFPLELPRSVWVPVLLGYGLVASVLPVWLLLQPRDYLSSFLLYAGLGAAVLGVLAGGLFLDDPVRIPATTDFMGGGFGPMVPLLFVTIACGAISGAHGLIASGTTSKQLDKESDARVIGYGGMLLEGVVAVLAISALAVVGFTGAAQENLAFALPKFAEGGAVFLEHLGVAARYGAPFMALLLASFLLTTLDTVTRLGRYLLEELMEPAAAVAGAPAGAATRGARASGPASRLSATVPVPSDRSALTLRERLTTVGRNAWLTTGFLVAAAWLLAAGGAWETLWPLFGGANQLLAALGLLAATAWFARWRPDKGLATTGIPAVVMLAITVSALGYLAYRNLFVGTPGASQVVQAVIAVLLVALGGTIAWDTARSVRSARAPRRVKPPVPLPADAQAVAVAGK